MPNPYESMQYLIDRGIDMTIKDYRWDSNAVGRARYGKRGSAEQIVVLYVHVATHRPPKCGILHARRRAIQR